MADYERARREAEVLGLDLSGPVKALIDALEDPKAGADALWQRVEDDPTSPIDLQLATLGANLLGDEARELRYRALEQQRSQFGVIAGRVARTFLPHDGPALYANTTDTFHGVFSYGRRMPQDALVPWLAQLIWE